MGVQVQVGEAAPAQTAPPAASASVSRGSSSPAKKTVFLERDKLFLVQCYVLLGQFSSIIMPTCAIDGFGKSIVCAV